MRRKRGVTLLELVLSLALLTVITATATTSFLSIKSLRQNCLNRDDAFARANLAVSTVFERALRAGAVAGVLAFDIQNGGQKVVLKRRGVDDTIWFDSSTNEIKYIEGNKTEKIILRGVQSLLFTNNYRQRLEVDLALQDGQKIRTSVQPRNQHTPQAVVN